MVQVSKEIKNLIVDIQNDCAEILLPPESGSNSIGQLVIPKALFMGTRGYIERIANQVNGCYGNGWYDASAVMIRRLLETLIIEVFETYSIAHKIQNTSGDFLYLSDLIDITLAEKSWNLGRNVKKNLPKLKDIGDKSAHSRRYNAVRNDIDKLLKDNMRDVFQELIYLAKLK